MRSICRRIGTAFDAHRELAVLSCVPITLLEAIALYVKEKAGMQSGRARSIYRASGSRSPMAGTFAASRETG